MGYQRKNRQLFIDKEALATLSLVKEGVLSPVTKLMNEKEAMEVDKTSMYKGKTIPFSFLLAPGGKRNENILKNSKKGDILDIIVQSRKRGELVVEEIFPIDKVERVRKIFSTTDSNHPGVIETLERLGNFAVSGEYELDFDDIKRSKKVVQEAISEVNAKKITGVMMAARPFHRAHERMIRLTLEKTDFLILFLLRPYTQDFLSYELRYKSLQYFVDNFLPKNRVLIVPFENTYIFAGINNVILDSIAAKNFGCTNIVIGQNHYGIGMYYDKNKAKTITDTFKGLDISIDMANEYVYCDQCKTLVSTKTCPHGSHHHISYNADLIAELFKAGVLPPAVLVRKEISAILLSELFPNRFESLTNQFESLFPGSGLLENHDDKDFYIQIMDLHQTVSLT